MRWLMPASLCKEYDSAIQLSASGENVSEIDAMRHFLLLRRAKNDCFLFAIRLRMRYKKENSRKIVLSRNKRFVFVCCSFSVVFYETVYFSHPFECIWPRFPAGTRWVRYAGTAFAQPFRGKSCVGWVYGQRTSCSSLCTWTQHGTQHGTWSS